MTDTAPRPVAAPRAYGPYLLLDQIGHGGMAEVFRAVRQGPEGFQRTFALKRISAQHAGSDDFVQMFCSEARISALLNHPNIVQVYDFGETEGTYYLAMEYLKGRTVLQLMRALRSRNRAVPAAMAAHIARGVALGLAYAHGLRGSDGRPLNLVHRDVTPANVMLTRSGEVKILDFGIAKAPTLARLQTQAGLIKGKLSYVSPEQLRGETLDGRADVFALGVTLWELLTLRKLFAGSTDHDICLGILQQTIEPPSRFRPGLPAALDDIVLQCLERDRSRRPDARAVAAALGTHLRDVQLEDDAVADLLRELFGSHTSLVVAVPAVAPPAPRATPATAVAVAPVADVAEAPPAAPAAPTRAARSWVAWALAAPAALSLLLWSAGLLDPLLKGRGGPAVAREVGRAEITVELDSTPRGASVERTGAGVLGATPLTVRLPRGEAPVQLVVSKPGYRPRVHAVVPDRDSLALIELSPAP